MMKSVINVCIEREGANKSDLSDIMSFDLPTTRIAKCFAACVLENVIIIKNGIFHKQGLIALGNMAIDKDDKERRGSLKVLAEKCESIHDNDRCDLALKLETCFQNVIGKRLIDFLNFNEIEELKMFTAQLPTQ
ncbi:unnamed protein product [Diamesa serratosioi]